MIDLDQYRFEPGEAMAAAQVEAANDANRQHVKDVWRRIEHELGKDGPMAEMLWAFRGQATKAMAQLIRIESTDPNVSRLQADVLRSLETMEHIERFANAAEAIDADEELETDLADTPLTFEDE